ncbi:transcription elongation factor GreA [Striga asiatica]|uniref:Transcription elongation factor GreA n=1 Tax=Striga asiatica TaxID=4170 RepID=A0A5A7P4I8_STRAF|nr:transcription elongation factor GreA [Striga asiatica]
MPSRIKSKRPSRRTRPSPELVWTVVSPDGDSGFDRSAEERKREKKEDVGDEGDDAIGGVQLKFSSGRANLNQQHEEGKTHQVNLSSESRNQTIFENEDTDQGVMGEDRDHMVLDQSQ